MEMTGEIQPGWIEAFAADAKFLSHNNFCVNDLDGDGIKSNVLGALPLLEAPIAMRPHYSDAWADQVLEKNSIEFGREAWRKARSCVQDQAVVCCFALSARSP